VLRGRDAVDAVAREGELVGALEAPQEERSEQPVASGCLARLPAMDRGTLDASPATGTPGVRPRSVPEARPTPLQHHFITLNVIALFCGAIAITALEFGAPLSSPIVRATVLIGGALLALTMADALLRVWRAAWAWMPVDRGKGLFRLVWAAVIVALYGVLVLAIWSVFGA